MLIDSDDEVEIGLDDIVADFPTAYEFLFGPERYKVAYGGRGSAKSWSFARALVIRGATEPIRWICARETMSSLRESVHKLLGDQIKNLQLAGYIIETARIWHENGTEFTFVGLKQTSGNLTAMKSYEGADGCWVEEAQNVSKESWDMLIPTIRKPGSQIWVSFNPVLETDDTYSRFVLNPPPNCITVKTSWRDNPYFNEILRIEMEHMRDTDPINFAHVWEGECRSAVAGAVYGEEMRVAESEGRITAVPYDRTKPVDAYWDLGFGDMTAVWMVQRVGPWFHLIDYLEAAGHTIDWYVLQLQQRNYVWGVDWLPHDGTDAIIHSKLAMGNRTKSIDTLLRSMGRKVRITPKLHIHEGINAARMLFPQCRFERTKCAQGLLAMRMYEWGEPSKLGIARREPLHNKFSHGADAFRGLAVSARQDEPEIEEEAPEVRYRADQNSGRYTPFI